MPCGRHLEDGLSLALCAFLRVNAAASGRIGASSGLKSARTLRKYLENVRGSSAGTTAYWKTSPNKRSFSPGGASSVCQTPERSGLPLEARGVLAERFGLPSRVRGVPGEG